MWDYKKADTNSIRKALKQVNWEFLFQNKSVHEQVCILNKTLLNVFANYVPNKIVTFNDKDPPWMTQYLKSQINWHNNVYQEYHKKINHSADDFIFLENVISKVSDLIFNRKYLYYNQLAQKLNAGLGMMCKRWSAPALSSAQIKKKGACTGDEKPALIQSCVS